MFNSDQYELFWSLTLATAIKESIENLHMKLMLIQLPNPSSVSKDLSFVLFKNAVRNLPKQILFFFPMNEGK